MRRDKNLVRDILLSVEADTGKIETDVTDDQDIINHHLHLMIDGGLLNGQEVAEGRWQIYALTWAGCELLDLIRDEDRWVEIGRITDDINCHSFGIIKKLAEKLTEK